VRRLRSHGITRDPLSMVNDPHGPWYYEQIELGFNYRMNDIQAALGMSQLQRLDRYVLKRHEIANRYDELLHELPMQLPYRSEDAYSSMHLYAVCVHLKEINASHKHIYKSLREQGIGVNLHYIPVHIQPYYESLGFRVGDYPNAERYYGEALTLPLYPMLTEKDQERVVTKLRRVLV